MFRIAVIGPESTGKTVLAERLARHSGAIYIEEYARTYVEQLSQPYTFDDVCAIARQQIAVLQQSYKNDIQTGYVFDTDLIITKIWFLDKYGVCPDWVEENLSCFPMDYYLVCYPDLPFVPDPVRENPHRRLELFEAYMSEVQRLHIPFAVVRGTGDSRFHSALSALSSFSEFGRRQ